VFISGFQVGNEVNVDVVSRSAVVGADKNVSTTSKRYVRHARLQVLELRRQVNSCGRDVVAGENGNSTCCYCSVFSDRVESVDSEVLPGAEFGLIEANNIRLESLDHGTYFGFVAMASYNIGVDNLQ
jgi:hypothetical protein